MKQPLAFPSAAYTAICLALFAVGCSDRPSEAQKASAAVGSAPVADLVAGSSGATSLSPVARLEQACVEAMLKNTCTIMSGPSASQTSSVVFVAGVGPIDSTAYRELKASGEAMCAVVRQSCDREWNGNQCKTARSLWPA